jgi:ABC-type uncharacterized transport system ATPase subunit
VLTVDSLNRASDVEIDQAQLMECNGGQARFRFNRSQIATSELITELVKEYPVRDVSIEHPEIDTIERGIWQRSPTEARSEDQC